MPKVSNWCLYSYLYIDMLAQLSNFIIEISLQIGQLLILKLRVEQNAKNFHGVFRQNWDIYVRIPPPSLREHHQRWLRKVIINSNWGIPEGDHLLDMEETQCLWTQIVWLLMQDLHNIKPGKSPSWNYWAPTTSWGSSISWCLLEERDFKAMTSCR